MKLTDQQKAEIKQKIDSVLEKSTSGPNAIPGIAAYVTDKDGNIYKGFRGTRTQGKDEPVDENTIFAFYSCTKAVTGVAILQLMERGVLHLDDPAKKFVPEIAKLQVIEGFNEKDEPILRPPKYDITVRHLLTHTAGFSYPFYSEEYMKLQKATGKPNLTTAKRDSIVAPLLFDPGTQWRYGINIDWLGLVLEGATGVTPEEYFKKNIFDPLNITSFRFVRDKEYQKRQATIHLRIKDNKLIPMRDKYPLDPELHHGGHGLYGTIEDFMKFLRMWLNDGLSIETGKRILEKETVALAVSDQLEPQGLKIVRHLKSANPVASADFTLPPGVDAGWGFTFLVFKDKTPTGKPAGSCFWCGLTNVYYWIDKETGIAGVWASHVLPCYDPACFHSYQATETAVYSTIYGESNFGQALSKL